MPDITTGLVGRWPCDETSGSVLHSSTGAGQDVTLPGVETWLHPGFNSDGSAPIYVEPEILAPFGYCAQFKIVALPDEELGQVQFIGDIGQNKIYISSDGLQTGNADAASGPLYGASSGNNAWHTIFVFDNATKVRTYFDGVFVSEINSSEGETQGEMAGYLETAADIGDPAITVINWKSVREYSRELSNGSVSVGQTAGGDIAALMAHADYLAAVPATGVGDGNEPWRGVGSGMWWLRQ